MDSADGVIYLEGSEKDMKASLRGSASEDGDVGILGLGGTLARDTVHREATDHSAHDSLVDVEVTSALKLESGTEGDVAEHGAGDNEAALGALVALDIDSSLNLAILFAAICSVDNT